MYYSTEYKSPLGKITIVSNDKSYIVGAWIDGQKYFCNSLKERPESKPDLPVLVKAVDWLDRYFQGKAPNPKELPLAPEGSDFRQAIWQMLLEIPYGRTVTYGELAQRIAKARGQGTMSSQAVGGAVGHNPISIIIPCHRVIGKDGSMTGYAGGVDKKIKLLELEGVLGRQE